MIYFIPIQLLLKHFIHTLLHWNQTHCSKGNHLKKLLENQSISSTDSNSTNSTVLSLKTMYHLARTSDYQQPSMVVTIADLISQPYKVLLGLPRTVLLRAPTSWLLSGRSGGTLTSCTVGCSHQAWSSFESLTMRWHHGVWNPDWAPAMCVSLPSRIM